MALQSIGGLAFIPDAPIGNGGNAPATANITVDADGEGYGMIFMAPETGDITGMGAPTGGTVTAGDAGMIWQLEGVDVSSTPAKPNGTIIAAGAVGNTNPSAADTWYNATFSTPYAATRGELLAAVIKRPTSGSFNGQFKVLAQVERGFIGGPLFPYVTVNAGAGWIANQGSAPTIAINYDGTYHMIRGSWPLSTITSTGLNTGTTPDVAGARWIPRFKCRVYGVWLCFAPLTRSYVIKFYNTDGVTVLATATAAANVLSAAISGVAFLPFDTSVTPTVGQTYRIGLEPDTANSVNLYDFTSPSSAIMAATSLGSDFCFTSAKNPTGTGSWTDVTTRKPFMGLALDQLSDGVGSGGGLLIHPGMSGGLRG